MQINYDESIFVAETDCTEKLVEVLLLFASARSLFPLKDSPPQLPAARAAVWSKQWAARKESKGPKRDPPLQSGRAIFVVDFGAT